MSSKLLNQRASEDEASRGASPATASSEDSRAMIGLIAAAAASVPPAAAASADSTSTPPTKATKAGKKKKAKATPVKEAAALADLASSDSGKSPAARQQHQLPMFLSSKSILVNTCCVLAWHIFILVRPHLKPVVEYTSYPPSPNQTIHLCDLPPYRDVSHDIQVRPRRRHLVRERRFVHYQERRAV